jgi:serine/threonine protein kinase
MGEVYRAIHTRLNRPAAIKVLHAYQAGDPSFQARFLREARSAASLAHPNIVEVFDFGEQDGNSYLVMELVPDGSLRTLLRQRSAAEGWSLALGLDLARQAAEGLAYAHARGMVHRDIKPDNLLLQRLSDFERDSPSAEFVLKISDFGLARLAESGEDLTVSGMVVGTPTYMSPEQCQGGTLDGRSDLYSLGVVLYEIATGSPPFRTKSLSEAVFKHISEPPKPPRQVRPDLPLALEQVILRCLAKRPEERYETATELMRALEGALSDTELMTVIGTPGAEVPTASGALPASVDSASVDSASVDSASVDPVAPTVVDASSADNIAHAPASDEGLRPKNSGSAVQSMRPAVSSSPARKSVLAPQRPSADQGDGAPRWPMQGAATKGGIASARSRTLAWVNASAKRRVGVGAVGVLVLLVIVLVASLAGVGRSPTHVSTLASPTRSHLTATATSTPVDVVKFQDALTASTGKWGISPHTFYASGGYEIAGAFISYAPGGNQRDVTLAARVREIGGPADQFFGLLFRGTSRQYYVFGIDASQHWAFSIVTGTSGKYIIPSTEDGHIKRGLNTSNVLTVRAKGSHFIFYANGVELGHADDTTLSSGSIGLINTVGNLQVVYNDFSIAVPS